MQKDWHTVDTATFGKRSALSRCIKRQKYTHPILDRAIDVEDVLRLRAVTGGSIPAISRLCIEAIERFEAALRTETSIAPDQREDVLPSTTVMVIGAVIDTLVNGSQ